MKLSDIMGHAGLSIYAEVALVLFLVAFVSIAWWVWRPGHRKRWDTVARLPLDDAAAPHTPRTGGPDNGK